ncbi:hypothetical protein ACHWQZ_G007054 [Mnemiopsis leidyi]
MFCRSFCLVTLSLFAGVVTTTDWTELQWWSSTSSFDFDPTTTTLENRFRDLNVGYYANYFHVKNYLYSDEKYLGFMQVYFEYKNYDKIESSWLRLAVEGVGYCKDVEVLGGGLANTISWDLTTSSVGAVNGTALADFTSCSVYPDWVALVHSGLINRSRVFFYSSYKQAIKADYRLLSKGI